MYRLAFITESMPDSTMANTKQQLRILLNVYGPLKAGLLLIQHYEPHAAMGGRDRYVAAVDGLRPLPLRGQGRAGAALGDPGIHGLLLVHPEDMTPETAHVDVHAASATAVRLLRATGEPAGMNLVHRLRLEHEA